MANLNQKKFPAAEDFPDLTKHNNWMAKCLTPEIYAKLRDRVTPNGYTIDQMIQTGVDNPGMQETFVNSLQKNWQLKMLKLLHIFLRSPGKVLS